jgi:hypothetical protein
MRKRCIGTAGCRPEAEADNRVEAEGEDGSSHGTTGFIRGAPWTLVFPRSSQTAAGPRPQAVGLVKTEENSLMRHECPDVLSGPYTYPERPAGLAL